MSRCKKCRKIFVVYSQSSLCCGHYIYNGKPRGWSLKLRGKRAPKPKGK
jgi:hypothetical protein